MRSVPDSVAVKALAIALVMAAAAGAQTSNRTVQLRYVPVERAMEAARAVSGVVVTGDRRTNRLVLSGPSAEVGKAGELAARADLPAPPIMLVLTIDDAGSMHTPVWSAIVSVQPGRPTAVSIETPGGIQQRTGATVVKGRVWVEGGPKKLSVRAELSVKNATGVHELKGSREIEPQKGGNLVSGAPMPVNVSLLPDPSAKPEAGR
jgi:hypothetical protein